MKRLLAILTVATFAFALPPPAGAHHGVASLGVAGLRGPGAPLETSSSATLPRGGFLLYGKLDYARFETFRPGADDEGAYNAFWMYGLGYGVSPSFSLYAFLPFYTKTVEDNSFNTSGFADMSVLGVLGFKADRGLRLVPANESLDDLEDWRFTVYGGLSLPTGKANLADAAGAIDPGMSLGFGRPCYQAGFTATKLVADRLTWVQELSAIAFSEYEYDDGQRVRFGEELRLNAALAARLGMNASAGRRLDGILEASLLRLGRDRLDGEGERATGGNILYLTPGLRLFLKSTSIGAGVKLPVWTNLNEGSEQQGAEGKENYRAIVSLSLLL